MILPLIKQEYVKKMTRETTMVKWQSRVLTEDDKERYVNALKYGKTRSFHVSVMVLGPNGAGKTTLIKRLQGEITKASSLTVPTQGLEISENRVRCVKDEDGQLVWEDQDEGRNQKQCSPDSIFPNLSKSFPNLSKIYTKREYVYTVAVYQKYLTRLGELIIFEPWQHSDHLGQFYESSLGCMPTDYFQKQQQQPP